MKLALAAIFVFLMPALIRAQASTTAAFPRAFLNAQEIHSLVGAGHAFKTSTQATGASATYLVRSPGYKARYEHVARVGTNFPRAIRRSDVFVLTGVFVYRPRPIRIPQVRYETKYVDRIIEKRVAVPVEVERKVFVDRPVLIDRPVLQTVERPVTHYIEKPVLPGQAIVGGAGVVAMLAGAFGYVVGAHYERRRIQKLRLTLPEFTDLTDEARRLADEHIQKVHRIAQHRPRSTTK